LPSRWFVYPSYGYENGPHNQGTVLVYNWANDAIRWSGMSDEDRVERALQDLQIMYEAMWIGEEKFDVKKYFTGSFKS
jgi:monoamine oxidase